MEELYQPNSIMIIRNLPIIALIFSGFFAQFAGVGVIATAISKLTLINTDAAFPSFIVIVNTMGVSFTEIFLGRFLTRYQGFTLGFYCQFVSVIITFLLAFANEDYVVLLLVFLLAVLMGFDNPNNNSCLNKLSFEQKNSISQTFSQYTTTIQIALVTSPIVTAFLIIYCGHKYAFLCLMFFYILASLPWLYNKKLRSLTSNTTDVKALSRIQGYKIIYQNKALRDLTVARVLNNLLFAGIMVLMPVIIARSSSQNNQFTIIQSICMFAMSAGFIANGFITKILLKKNVGLLPVFAKLATFLALCGIIFAIILNFKPYALYVMATIMGWAQFYLRLGSMSLGQAVTPKKYFAEAILAGDTIIRIFVTIYSISLLYLVGYFKSFMPFCIFCAISALAPHFLKRSQKIYNESK